MELLEFKKAIAYNQATIESAVKNIDDVENESDKVIMTEHGNNICGELLVVLKDGYSTTVTFLLTGWSSGSGNIYECIYTEA